MSAVSRVSIPNSVKKTIQIIKEIAGNHSDEEIYEMLKECSMDPNETAQKLLFQDTFHEVKRKRDKRKESTREATDNNRRPGSQGRVGRTARGIYSLRYTSHDSGDGRNLCAVKENGIAQVRDKDITSLHTTLGTNYKAASPEKKSSAYTSRSMDNLPNGLIKLEHQSADDPSFSGEPSVEETAVASKESVISFQKKLLVSSTGQPSSSITIASSEGINTPESEPVLVPFLDVSIPASVGAIKREANTESVISQDVGDSESPFLNGTGTLEKKNSFVNARVHGNSVEVEGTQFLDAFHSAPSTAIAGTSGSRPSSNYSNRSQHGNGHLKAGPAMEWKPKSTNVNPAPSSEVCYTSGVDLSKGEAREAVTYFLRASDSMVSDFSKKVLNLEGLCISDTQHVIIPDHLQVPESESTGLSFGSFGSNFGLDMRLKVEHEKIEYPEELSESSGGLEENVEQLPSCARDESTVAQENTYSDDQQPELRENNLSSATDIPSSISPPADYEKSQADVSLVTEGSQRSVIHTAPVYSNFGLMPQMLGSTFPTFEGADLHARDTARLPGFVVPQPFDPSTNYYTSIHRPTSDGDGRLSPFLYPGAAPKYNGSIAVLPPQTGQSPRESANTMILSSTGPTPIVTQSNGVLQTSVAATQQTLPIFRQPAGVHIAHYPPNYNPYNQYFSPFYVPPHAAIHHFVGNAAVFPQQPPTGSLYSHPSATAGTTPVKYPISQYKAAANSGPTGQRAYGMNPAGYSSAISGGNSTGGEDLSSFQFKENYVFITGQQSEGSPIWISPPGRDISTLQTGSFYNVPPHGQSVAFAPTQAGHAATFTGMYHPTQSVAAGSVHHLLQQSQAFDGASEFVGPPAGPQRSSQINWVSNF